MELQLALQMEGFETLRDYQEAALNQMIERRAVLVIAGTGTGKSAIFVSYALIAERLVVVIEPHLALEFDQVRQLQERGIAAEFLNGTQNSGERAAVLEKVAAGTLRLLYLTPEMAQNRDVAEVLRKADIAGFAIDEAHCLIRQGPGFREEYLQLPDLIAGCRNRPVVAAFTATATPRTAQEIVKCLGMHDAFEYRGGVTRDNIRLSVIEIGHSLGGRKDAAIIEQRKREEICRLLDKYPERKTIVYCNTVARVKKLKKFLRKNGYNVELFHGKCDDKAGRLQRFASGEVNIMVATNAFGLGVNISDVRLVIHHSPSIGMDDYVQEVGRAGRNGKQAKAVLLWHAYDFTINRGMIEKARLRLTGDERRVRLTALDVLQAYAVDTGHCRWRKIRKFFGESKGKRCENQCDNCRRTESVVRR